MKRTLGARRLLVLVPAAICAGGVLAFLLGVDFGPLHPFMERWSFLILELAGAVACLARAACVRSERVAWTLIGIGLLLWALGDAYWRVVLFTMETPPVPSPADALWIGFYPFAYAGIVLLIHERARGVRASVWIDGLIAALAIAAVSAAVVFDAVLGSIGGVHLTTAVDLAYPLADMLLVAIVVAGLAMTGWRLDRTWLWLAASLAMFAVTDSVYLYQVANGTYTAGGVLDAGWALALLLGGAAAWQRGQRPEASTRVEKWSSIAFPIGFALVVVGVETYDHFHPVALLALVLSAACLLAVLLRLAFTFAQNLRMLQSSREDAATDALTGLANRRQLDRDLAELFQAPAASPEQMQMHLDLNGFKLYNDTFGHPAGDALLTRISDHLTRVLSDGGKAYRMGGDEFCVLIATQGGAPPEPIATTIAAALSERGEGFTIDASYGWVILPREASDPEHALRVVDQRMYVQKEGGRVSARAQSKNVLVQALLERSPDLTEHLTAVSSMAVATGHRLGLGETELETIEVAGALHDIGKVAIPDEILNKAGALDDEEWQYVKSHSIVGERIVGAAPALEGVATLVRSVHERVDGSGYPDQLLGADIPLGSRILAVVDAFHAMTSGDRPYRTAIDEQSALAELRRCAGTQFDEAVVEAFLHTRSHAVAVGRGVQPHPLPGTLRVVTT